MSVAGASGLLQLRSGPDADWRSIEKTPIPVRGGTELRTGRQSAAYVRLGRESTALLQEDTVLTVEEERAERLVLRLDIGVAEFRFGPQGSRKVQVRTPAAALTLRGTEFRLAVLAGGRTTVELAEGELGVEDNRGHQLLLRRGESVRVDLRGLEVPRRLAAAAQLRREGLRERIRREAEGDAFRERLYSEAARAARRSQWEEGKVLIDSAGERVRAETWVLRPRADQLELVAVNAAPGRTDYFFRRGTFSGAVPDDISGALRAMAGTAGSRPPLTLTAYEQARSNGTDVVYERADGGHLVDLNNNADGADDLASVFDPVAGVFTGALGRSAWVSLFDRYGLYVNGRLAAGWTGSSIQAVSEATPVTTSDPFSGAALTAANALVDPGGGGLVQPTKSVTAPLPGAARQLWAWTWSDGSTLTAGNAAASGGAAAGVTLPATGSPDAFRAALPGRRLEQTLTSTLFGGRRIDLSLDPALGMTMGLVP